MKIKILFLSISLCFLFTLRTVAQTEPKNKNELAIYQACALLDSSLVAGNLKILQEILHPKLSFGHSNGLIENKTVLIQDLQNGFLKYNQIVDSGIIDIRLLNKIASVRRQIKVNGYLKGKAFEIWLSVLETWVKEGRNWKLFSRQSIKQN